MKKPLLLAMAIGCFAQSHAQLEQILHPGNEKMKAHRAMVGHFLKMNNSNTAQKPTGVQHRVIAQAMRESSDPADSTFFKYSGTRGSKYNFDNMNLTYNRSFESMYTPMYLPFGADNPMDLLADSLLTFYDDELYYVAAAAYRPDNKISSSATVELDPGGNYYSKTLNNYNAGGHITASYMLQSDDGVDYDTFQIRKLSYNAAMTQVASDSIFLDNGATLATVVKYYYNGQNKFDSIMVLNGILGTLTESRKFTFTYYGTGKLQKLEAVELNSAPASQVDSFGYGAGTDYTTFWETRYVYDTDVFGNRIIKYPGANGLPDSASLFEMTNNNWTDLAKVTYTYTPFDAPDSLAVIAGNIVIGTAKFYYEEYDDGLSIKPITENKDFSVYPNPFRDNISIDWKGKQSSQVNVQLVNILGQKVHAATMKLHAGKNTIDLPGINSGSYILIIQDANGKSWSTKLVKQ